MIVPPRIASVVTSVPVGLIVVLAAVACVMGLGAAPAAAQSTLASIPVFQGAALDAAAAKILQKERGDVPDNFWGSHFGNPASRVTQVYSTSAGVEDVLAFYIKALNARPDDNNDPFDPGTVKRGSASSPAWQAEPYAEELQDSRAEATGEVIRPGAWVRKVLSARKQFNGQWMGVGAVRWMAKGSDGSTTIFQVSMLDRSFDNDGGTFSKTRNYAQKTYILVQSAFWK